MDINQNYREAVKAIKEAILRSHIGEQRTAISLLRHRTLRVEKFPYRLLG